jgi:hypothetical protein
MEIDRFWQKKQVFTCTNFVENVWFFAHMNIGVNSNSRIVTNRSYIHNNRTYTVHKITYFVPESTITGDLSKSFGTEFFGLADRTN